MINASEVTKFILPQDGFKNQVRQTHWKRLLGRFTDNIEYESFVEEYQGPFVVNVKAINDDYFHILHCGRLLRGHLFTGSNSFENFKLKRKNKRSIDIYFEYREDANDLLYQMQFEDKLSEGNLSKRYKTAIPKRLYEQVEILKDIPLDFPSLFCGRFVGACSLSCDSYRHNSHFSASARVSGTPCPLVRLSTNAISFF